MPLFVQDIIHKLELGGGHRVLKTVVGIIAIVALALLYDLAAFRNFSSPAAMDNAQLARNIAEGKGFRTEFIRPFSLYLLKRQTGPTPTNSAPAALAASPDISNPPAYPLVLAMVLKVMPFDYPDLRNERSFTTWPPELWIAAFNQLLVIFCAALVFLLARRLFDEPVAWVSTAAFAATESFWRHSTSGLPILWLAFLILLIFVLLARLDTNLRRPDLPNRWAIPLAATIGMIAAIAGLSRYALLFLIVPLAIYLATLSSPRRVALALAAFAGFLVLVTPWLVRNYSLSGTLFGTGGYTALQQTAAFPGDTLMRSLSPDFSTITAGELGRKFLLNLRYALSQVPQLAGSWVSVLFLVGLLMPFRSVVTSRLRGLLLAVLGGLLLIEAALSSASNPTSVLNEASQPDYLVLAAPVTFVFGISLLFTLLEQFAGWGTRYLALSLFFLLAAGPLILTFAAPPVSSIVYPPYYPPWIQAKASYLAEDEWMMSDMPWAVAWYGHRSSVWLSPSHGTAAQASRNDFYSINRLKPVHGLHLSARTLRELDGNSVARWRQTEGADVDWETFKAQVRKLGNVLDPGGQNTAALDPLMETYSLAEKHWIRGAGVDWDSFALGIVVTREVPVGFPLKMAPEGLLPEIFLTDSERRREKTIKPSKQVQSP
jgi:hypothetical protein